MIVPLLAALALPATIPNPSFERGLAGWTVEGHRGLGAGVQTNALLRWPQAAQGDAWLNAGWRARNAAPPGAAKSVTTSISARLYRGRRLRVTAMTKAPPFASGASLLRARAGAVSAETRIGASEGWRLHAVELAVPSDAEAIEIGFVVEGTAGELEADDVRLEIVG